MSTSVIKRAMFLSVVAGLLFVNIWGPAHAGELIDHLPEVQMARAIAEAVAFQDQELQDPLDDPEISEICAMAPTLADIPDQLWLDAMGEIRTPDEVRRVLIFTQCAFASLEGNREEQDGSFVLGLLGGRDKTLGEGIIIPGSKEPVRVVLAFPTFITMFFELVFSSLPGFEGGPILGEAPCERLRSLAVEGESLELRWAAFMTLVFDRANIELEDFGLCGAASDALTMNCCFAHNKAIWRPPSNYHSTGCLKSATAKATSTSARNKRKPLSNGTNFLSSTTSASPLQRWRRWSPSSFC